MTAEEAISVLQQSEGQGYVGWDEERCIPDVRNGTIVLDGAFSARELEAMLVFFSDSRERGE